MHERRQFVRLDCFGLTVYETVSNSFQIQSLGKWLAERPRYIVSIRRHEFRQRAQDRLAGQARRFQAAESALSHIFADGHHRYKIPNAERTGRRCEGRMPKTLQAHAECFSKLLGDSQEFAFALVVCCLI